MLIMKVCWGGQVQVGIGSEEKGKWENKWMEKGRNQVQFL